MEVQAETFNRLESTAMSTELVQCPNCAERIKATNIAQHCEEELENLQRMQMKTAAGGESPKSKATNGTDKSHKTWTVYQKVQRNRHTRLKQRTRKRPLATTSTPPERTCPVCNKNFPQDNIEHHVEACLKRSKVSNGNNEHSSSDEDAGEEYEEYEWAGHKRIRVSSMLVGGYAAIGIGQTIVNSYNNGSHEQAEEEEDLNVDEDDTHIYGPPQYGEYDIIPPDADNNRTDGNDDEDVTSYMRKLITEGENGEREKITNKERTEIHTEATTSNGICTKKFKSNVYEQIIDSLKAKLRLYEQQQQNKFKCLICLDEYKKPAISVSCWHVHCEECWLRSLGTRKLCPQCNLITTPKDLRRIYM